MAGKIEPNLNNLLSLYGFLYGLMGCTLLIFRLLQLYIGILF
jgi:hypothetical protein